KRLKSPMESGLILLSKSACCGRNGEHSPFDSDPYSTSKVIQQRRSARWIACAQAMVNNFAPRGARTGIKLAFGTAGPTVTPSKFDEYSDPAGRKAQARLSLFGR